MGRCSAWLKIWRIIRMVVHKYTSTLGLSNRTTQQYYWPQSMGGSRNHFGFANCQKQLHSVANGPTLSLGRPSRRHRRRSPSPPMLLVRCTVQPKHDKDSAIPYGNARAPNTSLLLLPRSTHWTGLVPTRASVTNDPSHLVVWIVPSTPPPPAVYATAVVCPPLYVGRPVRARQDCCGRLWESV